MLSSKDEVQDALDRELFVQKYQEMHRLGRDADGSMTLYIGAENWPFPIPLVQKDGSWRFDPDKGQDEILFRRIGENELGAIATCQEFVDAELPHCSPNVSRMRQLRSSNRSTSARRSSECLLKKQERFRTRSEGDSSTWGVT